MKHTEWMPYLSLRKPPFSGDFRQVVMPHASRMVFKPVLKPRCSSIVDIIYSELPSSEVKAGIVEPLLSARRRFGVLPGDSEFLMQTTAIMLL